MYSNLDLMGYKTKTYIYSTYFRWTKEMEKLFSQHGLNVLDYQRLPIDIVLAKPWTDMQIMALEDVMENSIIPAGPNDSKESPTAEKWRDMLRLLVQRCQKGMSITMDMVFVVGQKPSKG